MKINFLNDLKWTSALLISLFLTAHVQAATYDLDPSHSRVTFRVKHLNVSYFYGQLFDPTGTIAWDQKDLKKSQFDIAVKVDNLDTHNEKRDAHVKGPDFFNSKAFPVIKFTSKKITPAGKNKYNLTGELSLHGVKKTITVPLHFVGAGKDPWGGQRVGFDAHFSIKRSDYGMKFMQGALGDKVDIWVGLEAVQKK